MSLGDHLNELRTRLLRIIVSVITCTGLSFFFTDYLLRIIITPFQSLNQNIESSFVVSTLFEGFLTKLNISLYSGILLSSPIILYHILRFCFPGLTKKEQKASIAILVSSFVLIIAGVGLAYTKIIPLSLGMLLSDTFIFSDADLYLNFHHTVFYIIHFLLIICLAFQFPIAVDLLLAFKLISFKRLLKSSRWIVIGLAIFSAIITPPDIVSQLGIFVPLLLLYSMSLLIAFLFKWGR